jgi:predicted  nucleic acid-binding Zn-ribbon protein
MSAESELADLRAEVADLRRRLTERDSTIIDLVARFEAAKTLIEQGISAGTSTLSPRPFSPP